MFKKCFTVAAISLLLCGSVFAGGVQIGMGAGYGFGAGRDDVGANYEVNSNGDYTKYKDVRASFGNGIKLDVDVNILLNDNLGILIGTGFSMLGGFKIEGKSPTTTYTEKMRANYLPIYTGLKLQAGDGKFVPYVYIGPGIFIPIGTKGEDLTEATGLPDETDEITTKFTAGFGIFSGIGALLNLSDKIGLKFECAPTYAFARLTEIEIKYDDDTKETIIFKKDEKNLPDDTNDTYYEHGVPMYSFSSIAAKVGIIINIGK